MSITTQKLVRYDHNLKCFPTTAPLLGTSISCVIIPVGWRMLQLLRHHVKIIYLAGYFLWQDRELKVIGYLREDFLLINFPQMGVNSHIIYSTLMIQNGGTYLFFCIVHSSLVGKYATRRSVAYTCLTWS